MNKYYVEFEMIHSEGEGPRREFSRKEDIRIYVMDVLEYFSLHHRDGITRMSGMKLMNYNSDQKQFIDINSIIQHTYLRI